MVRTRGLATAIMLVAGFLLPGAATAGPILEWFGCDCPPPEFYSPYRYWTPGLARLHDKCHGPKTNVYPPDRHPEIPITFTILRFPCPAVDPAATLIEPPTPPAESRSK